LIQICASVVLFLIGCVYLCCYCGIKTEKQEFKMPENPIAQVVDRVVKKEAIANAVGEVVKKEVGKALDKR
jgi:radical SAM superfamily enzyme YgiQ (UPF0313 family)